jgi:hypothetical protein
LREGLLDFRPLRRFVGLPVRAISGSLAELIRLVNVSAARH